MEKLAAEMSVDKPLLSGAKNSFKYATDFWKHFLQRTVCHQACFCAKVLDMMWKNIDLKMKADTIVPEKEGDVETHALTATTKLKGRVMKGHSTAAQHSSLAEVEPYVAFLFHHWDNTVRANPTFDGQAVQELLWRQWESAELADQQRSGVEISTRKRKRECEGEVVVADLLSEMLNSITQAKEVADGLIEELLDRVCPKKTCIVYDQMAETVLGNVKVAELGLMEIRGE